MPITKPFDEITESDLLKLIDAVENESKVLDYKEVLRLDAEGAKDEYRRDVTSFANASGGDIIVGMKEDAEGKPLELTGFDLEKSTAENYQIRLIDLCQSKITPRRRSADILLSWTYTHPGAKKDHCTRRASCLQC